MGEKDADEEGFSLEINIKQENAKSKRNIQGD
jgi:hypothetical protein